MKNRLIYKAFILAVASIIFWGCEEDANYIDYSNYYPEAIANGFSPTIGFPGQEITITGTNLDTLSGAVKVWFGGIPATATDVVSSNITEVVVKVPVAAVSGQIDMQVWTTKIDSIGIFTVLPAPAISSVISKGLAANIAEPGDLVLISGQNFLIDPEKITIDFNGTPATEIVSLSSTLIEVKAPVGYSAGMVNVTFNGDFTVVGSALAPGISPGDVSVIFLKNYMQPFTTNNMTSDQSFNGKNWGTPDHWIVNAAAQNQINSGATERCGGLNFGKPNMANVGELCMQAGWSDAIGNVITNGKIYQSTILPAGTYQVDIEVMESGFKNYQTESAVYLVVANGTTLPDLNSVDMAPSAVLSAEVIQNGIGYGNTVNQSVTFTLTEQTEVSIGFVGTLVANSYLRMNYMKLTLFE